MNSRLNSRNIRLTIVTAADKSHGKSLLNLLKSIKVYEPNASVIIWDLGLTDFQRIQIKNNFQTYELKKFNFNSYPKYFNIDWESGQYAWKPAIIFEETRSKIGILLWLDAGNLLTGNLKRITKLVNSKCFYSPYSAGSIEDWTHPLTLKFLKFPIGLLSRPNCNGAVIGFKLQCKNVQKLIYDWNKCALNKSCIAPIGSSRKNHRQDQAVLSVISELSNFNPVGRFRNLNSKLNILTHQDVERQKS
jgi:hypothetical protein